MPIRPSVLVHILALVACAAQSQTWGFNYDRTSTGPSATGGKDVTLKELFDTLGPQKALTKLSTDFSTMHRLNGTSVRLFVNLPDLVSPPPYAAAGGPSINTSFLSLLVAACDAAGASGVSVDLTGSTFERQDAMGIEAWVASSDEDLLAARAAFWGAASAGLRGHPSVRNFNLVNEPFVVYQDFVHDVVTGCIPVVRPNNDTSTFCYLHPIFRHATRQWTQAMHALFPTPAALGAHWRDYPLPGETFDALAIPGPQNTSSCRHADYQALLFNKTRDWCATLAGTIKGADPSRLVTVGIQFGSSFPDTLTARACAGSVDFFSIHLYPRGDFATASTLQEYFQQRLDILPQDLAMNVTWEEFYPMGQSSSISMEEIPGILLAASRAARKPLQVQSHFSFYWGTSESLDMSPIGAAIYNQWLALWASARPFSAGEVGGVEVMEKESALLPSSFSLPLCIPKGVWAGPCVWPSVPPADCPIPLSTLLQGVSFNGTFGSFPTTSADTWYASPGPNGTLFSAFADGHACTSDGGATPAPLPPDLVALQWWWSVGAQDNVLSTAAFPPSNTTNSYELVGVLGYALAGSGGGGGGGGSNTTFCELALWRGGANSEYWTTCGAEEEAAATAAHYTLVGRLNASLPTSPHHAPDLRPLPPTTPIDMPSGTQSGWAPSAQFYSIARNDHFASPEPIPAGYVLQRGMGEMLLHLKDCVTVSGETQTQGFALLQQPQGGTGGSGEGLFNLTVLSVGTVPHPPQNFPGLSIPPPYGVYPSTAFAFKGLWAYGYYLLADPSGAGCSNWCHLGPLLAFAISTNGGRSFSYPGSSLWGEGSGGGAGAGTGAGEGARGVFEPLNVSSPIRLGVPRFVDLGLDLEHSPDGRAYLVGKGCDANDGVHCSFMTGDSAFLARTAQTMEVVVANASALNDPLAWEFWGGEGVGWVDTLANAHPIFAWPGAVGGITMTYNAPLQRFIAIVNLPSDRVHPTDCEFDTYVLESQSMTGPFSMVSYMHALGPQMYFQHASSSGWSEDGLQGVLFSSGNWDGACIKQGSNPPGERYGLVTTQFGLVMK